MKTTDYIFLSVLFYVGWFGCVFLARTDFSEASLIFPLLLLGFLHFKKSLTRHDCVYALSLSLIGIIFDHFAIRFELISVSEENVMLIPVWLISIWLLFTFSMLKFGSKLHPPLWLAAMLGGIMGPISYKSGEYFQVLKFLSPLTFFIYAAFWAVVFPLTLYLSRRLA